MLDCTHIAFHIANGALSLQIKKENWYSPRLYDYLNFNCVKTPSGITE